PSWNTGLEGGVEFRVGLVVREGGGLGSLGRDPGEGFWGGWRPGEDPPLARAVRFSAPTPFPAWLQLGGPVAMSATGMHGARSDPAERTRSRFPPRGLVQEIIFPIAAAASLEELALDTNPLLSPCPSASRLARALR